MDKEFANDLYEGLSKIVEVGKWLLDCLNIETGRNVSSWKKEEEKKNKDIIIVEKQEDLRKKEEEKSKKSTPTEKGVDTMKKHCSRRKDGRWQYSMQRNGYLYYAIASTYRQLLEKIPQIKPRLVKAVKRIKCKDATFIQYFETYIETFVKPKPVQKATKYEWTHQLEKYIKPHVQRLPLESITTEQLQKVINSIKFERTRERVMQKIKKVVQKAYISGKIKKDVSLGLEKLKRTKTQERPPLTLEEQKALLQRAKNSRVYAFVMFSLVVGSRREESVKFNIETDLNEDKMLLHIKGTKTKNADRYVKVSRSFVEFLKSNLIKGKFEYSKDFYTKAVGDLFRDLGIENCLHGLRHTCAANLYFLGANDKYRQMQLGHSSIVTTNDIYTNIKENIAKADLRELYGDLYPQFD